MESVQTGSFRCHLKKKNNLYKAVGFCIDRHLSFRTHHSGTDFLREITKQLKIICPAENTVHGFHVLYKISYHGKEPSLFARFKAVIGNRGFLQVSGSPEPFTAKSHITQFFCDIFAYVLAHLFCILYLCGRREAKTVTPYVINPVPFLIPFPAV